MNVVKLMSYSTTESFEGITESMDFKDHDYEGSKLKQKDSDPSAGCPDGYLYEDGNFYMYYPKEGKFYNDLSVRKGREAAGRTWKFEYVTYNGVKIFPDVLTLVKRGIKDIMNCYGDGYELLMDDYRVYSVVSDMGLSGYTGYKMDEDGKLVPLMCCSIL